jgi:predicted dehydrogenase
MLAAHSAPRFALHGTAGSFAVAGLDAQEAILKTNPNAAAVAAPGWGREARVARLWRAGRAAPEGEPVPLVSGAYPAFYAEWVLALEGRAACPVPVSEALGVQLLLDAGRASAAGRHEQRLPPAPWDS